jgi:hypothetical protein
MVSIHVELDNLAMDTLEGKTVFVVAISVMVIAKAQHSNIDGVNFSSPSKLSLC